MESLLPYASPFFLGVVGSVWVTFLIGLHSTTGRWGQPLVKRLVTLGSAAIGLLVWFVALLILADQGFFKVTGEMPPKIIFILIPPIVGIVIHGFSKGIGKLVNGIPWHWMPALQSFRVGVEAVLWVLAANKIAPEEMSVGGWNFDILIGFGGILVAILLAKNPKKFRNLGIAYNFIGMAVLAVVVITGIGSATGLIETHPQNTFIGEAPYVLLPGYLVPMAYLLHILNLRQLMGSESTSKSSERMFT